MSLFPTLHVTGDLPAAHRSHLENHGITLVGAGDDPDVVLVLPGTRPVAAHAGTVVVATGDDRPATVALLATHGIAGRTTQAVGALALAAVGVPDLLAWTSDLTLPVRAVLDLDEPAVALLRLGERGPVVAAGTR